MNNNYLIFNNLGILDKSDLHEISQGNKNVDYYLIGYDVYDYTNSYLTIAITLPNGTELPELSTSQKDFEFDGIKYKGYMFKLLENLTAISGNLTATFILKSVENDTELCSSQVNITIHETDNVIDPTITSIQYNQMQETIREEFAEIDRKIEEGQLKGEKGDKGEQGAKGDKGDTATITIGETISVSSDKPAKVTNVGTKTDAILNFEIPKAKGAEINVDNDTIQKDANNVISINKNILSDINNNKENIEKLEQSKASIDFVNSSISTATATFRGTHNSVNDLPTQGVDINDYAFVISIDSNGNTAYNKYKFTTKWEYEYTLNNSSFTAKQWEAIQSGINSTLVTQISTNANAITNLENNKANSSELVNLTSRVSTNEEDITNLKLNKLNKEQGIVNAKKMLYVNDFGMVDLQNIKTKLSEFDNDTDFVKREDIAGLGSKIDSISVNGVAQEIVNKNVNITVPTDYATISDLNDKQDKLSDSQLNAVNSGVNSTLVAQITTNKNDINNKANQNSLDITNQNISSLTTRVSNNETNISNKVEKYNNTTGNPLLYGRNQNNEEYMYNLIGDRPVAWAVLQRNGDGQIAIGDPTSDNHGTTKKYVDTELSKKASIDFVNSSIATNTATYRGSFDTLEELKATEADNNDYAFLQGGDGQGNLVWKRYKYNGTEWLYEYTLNNSSFTAAQWATINSGVTEDTVTKVNSNTNSISLLQDNKADKTELDSINSTLASYNTTLINLNNNKVDKTTKINNKQLSEDITISKSDVGLSNVDNTSDADKPISTATQAALNKKLDASSYVVDNDFDIESTNPIQNRWVTNAFLRTPEYIRPSYNKDTQILSFKLTNKDDTNYSTEVVGLSSLAKASDLNNYVPNTRTINGKSLSDNVTLNANDVGALPNTTTIPSIEGLASETFVTTKISELINSAPETLDTLGEIATALKDNEDVVEALNTSIGNKADKTELNNYFKYGTSNAPKADANDTVAMTNLFSNSGNQVGFTGIIAGDEIAPILAMYSSINKASSIILSDNLGNTLQISSDGNIFETSGSTSSSGKIVNSSELAAVATTGSYNSLSNKPTIPTAISQLTQDATHRIVTDTQISTWNAKSNFSGNYNDLTNKPTIPTKTSQLTNDSNFLTSADITSSVTSVNGKTGVVQLTASDVGALPDTTTIPNNYLKTITKSTTIDYLDDVNFGGRQIVVKNENNGEIVRFINYEKFGEATSTKHGLMTASDKNKLDNLPSSAVSSVNGQTGDVTINVPDVSGFISTTANTFNTSSGGIKFSNGLIINWGTLSISSNGEKTINFKYAFSSGVVPIVMRTNRGSGSGGVTVRALSVYSISNTSFKVYGYTDDTPVSFIAIGY